MNDNREFSRLAMEQFARTVEGQTMIIRDGEIAGKVINVRVTDDGKVMATLTFLGGEHVEFRIGSFERRPGLDPMFCTCGPDAHLLRERCTVCRAAATRAHRAAIDEEIAKAVNSAAVRFMEPENLPDAPLVVGPQPEPDTVGTPFTAANLTPDFAADLKLWDESIASNGPFPAIGIRRDDPYRAFERAVRQLGNSCLAAVRLMWAPLIEALDKLTPLELAQLRAELRRADPR